MNDVLPEIGGYLPVRIDRYGYIRLAHADDAPIVHRETLHLHRRDACVPTLSEAKERLPKNDDEIAVLELTAQGAGAALWMREEQREELDARRARFKGCYGLWPTYTFSRDSFPLWNEPGQPDSSKGKAPSANGSS